MKTIDFSRSLFDLVSEFPEIKDIMYSIGFEAITKPGMLQTAGRYVTIPKGAQMKKFLLKLSWQLLKHRDLLWRSKIMEPTAKNGRSGS